MPFNFTPELWSTRLVVPYKKALVYASCVNNDYEGEIKEFGDTVRIGQVGPVTVSDYAGTVNYQEIDDDATILKIDKQKYFGFVVKDIEAAQSNVTYMDESMNNAAYSLKDAVDQVISGLYVQAGSISAATAVNSTNIVKVILSMGQALDDANVPSEGRWLVLPSWAVNCLIIAKILVENTTNDAFTNGSIGRALGFDIRKSNNVTVVGGTNYKFMAGVNDAISYAGQIDPAKIEALRDKDTFGTYVRGLLLFGAKVVKPAGLVVIDATIAAEP